LGAGEIGTFLKSATDKGMEQTPRIFLTAEWRELAMLNYTVDPGLLHRFVPQGTELDVWGGQYFLSLVGFRFIKTKVRGIPVPGHRNFDEVNLRFYVRRRVGDDWRRGVVFIREIVPKRAIAFVARVLYNEKYIALPMSHQIADREGSRDVEYRWTFHDRSNKLSVAVSGEAAIPAQGSEEHFITEHFWGYSAQPGGSCLEYRVEHPSWPVWIATKAHFEGDVAELYGQDLAAILQREPDSAFLAVGSPVTVYHGRRI
jgi:uncharacterized protein YqjF (DUF2071 family)